MISAMKELGMPIILWNLDTVDWKYRDAESVKNHILEQAQDGSIVLEHDLYETTVEGVLAAIDELQAQGYAFVTVSELAELKGVTLEPGEIYSDFTAETLHPEQAETDTDTNTTEDAEA
jgi:peptidoglycan/xylan/chitin deacetylase (PgdA/CDA1 family)